MSPWPTKQLGDLVRFVGGGTPSRDRAEYWNGAIPWASVKDLQSLEIEATAETITEERFRNSAASIVSPNTVVIASRVELGKASITLCSIAINQDLKALVPFRANILPRYLLYYFVAIADQIEQAGVGATVKGVTIEYLEKLELPLPPLPEQERIVQILDEVEALRRLRAQTDDRVKELSISLFLEMFGNPLSGSSQWQTKRVSDICDLVRGSSPRPKGDPRYFGGPVPRLMIEDITRDGWWVTPKIDSLTIEGARLSRPVKAGTVVMAVGGNIGLCAQLAVDACVHDGFVAFTNLDQASFDSFFFGKAMSLLKEMNTRVQAGAIFQNITTTDVKALEVICPPLPVQQEFSARVDEIHELETAQAARRQRLDDLFQALLHRAFQGKL